MKLDKVDNYNVRICVIRWKWKWKWSKEATPKNGASNLHQKTLSSNKLIGAPLVLCTISSHSDEQPEAAPNGNANGDN